MAITSRMCSILRTCHVRPVWSGVRTAAIGAVRASSSLASSLATHALLVRRTTRPEEARRSIAHARFYSTAASVGSARVTAAATASSSTPPCALCLSPRTGPFSHHPRTKLVGSRWSHRCHECELVFIPAEYHLAAASEKQRYDAHTNDAASAGYRASLDKLIAPLAEIIKQDAHTHGRDAASLVGLDFGCGPNPVLSDMMQEKHGLSMEHYDPFFHPNE